MCGRFSLAVDQQELEERFSFKGSDLRLVPSFNVAPAQSVLAIIDNGGNLACSMRWGLIPSWAKDAKIGSRMINARAETVAERPSFRVAFRRRRCLVPADGFFEWTKRGSARRPMRIVMRSGEPFAFAGLWESWQDPAGERVLSCTIITTDPNSLISPIHNRMPVILSREAEPFWLDRDTEDTAVLSELLVPYPAEEMEAYEVSTLVNSPRNNGPECIARIGRMV